MQFFHGAPRRGQTSRTHFHGDRALPSGGCDCAPGARAGVSIMERIVRRSAPIVTAIARGPLEGGSGLTPARGQDSAAGSTSRTPHAAGTPGQGGASFSSSIATRARG